MLHHKNYYVCYKLVVKTLFYFCVTSSNIHYIMCFLLTGIAKLLTICCVTNKQICVKRMVFIYV